MKKVMLLTKSFVILSLLFCSIGVFADIPRTINVQGKVTNDSGGPILNPNDVKVKLCISDDRDTFEFGPIEDDLPVKIDSEGLYNVNMDLSSMRFDIGKKYKFEVEVYADNTVIRSGKRSFASSPFAFYASTSTYSSTATYSLKLDPVKGEKLVSENFITVTSSPTYKYTIRVTTAIYAVKASSISASMTNKQGYVWGISDDGKSQLWKNPGDIAISTAAADKLGGIMLGQSTDNTTGLYIPSGSAVLKLKAATASTIGGVIVSTGTGTGLTITDGVLGISPASADGFGVVKVNSGNGLNNNSGTISISTDTEPTQNSNKLLTSGVIYSTMTSIYSDLAGKISGITLGAGNGIEIDTANKIKAVGDNTKGIEVGGDGIGITLATNSGLEFNSGLKVSTDTKPTQNSNKLLTSGVIYSTMTSIYSDLAGKISGITLGAGNGIEIDTANKIKAVGDNTKGIEVGGDGIGITLATNSGLEFNSGLKVSTDTKPTQNSNKLLTSGVIYSTMTSIYSDLAGKISGITLGSGNGIDIDATTKDISAVGDSSKGIEVGGDGIGITLATNSGLEFNSGLKVSTDTEPTQNSNKLLTSGVIYSTMTNIYNDLAGKISGITLGEGDGIDIDQNTKTISVALANNGGLKVVSGGLAISVDTSTIDTINDSTGTLTVKALPRYMDSSNPEKKVWGYKSSSFESQGWLSVLDIEHTSVEEGLTLDGIKLRVSTATETGLVFNGTDENAVLKVSTGTGLAIDDDNKVIVSTGAGLAFDADNKVIVSTGAGLAIDSNNGIVVSTGTGLDFDVNNKIYVTSATADYVGGFKLASTSAKDSGLVMDAGTSVLKISTGTGLVIDTETNTVNVTTAPYAIWASSMSASVDDAQNIIKASRNNTYYVWGMLDDNTKKQGWVKMYKTDSTASWQGSVAASYYYVGADLAEIYQSTEKLVPGDVVSIDPAKDNAIVKTKVAEDTMVAGVISTEPGVLMNQDEKGYKLALVGKVPTKVCNEGGAIKRGDLLVSASIPGYAKKAGDNPKVGTVIGKALENSDSQKGTILVLVNLQ